eukprot:sb/3465118/
MSVPEKLALGLSNFHYLLLLFLLYYLITAHTTRAHNFKMILFLVLCALAAHTAAVDLASDALSSPQKLLSLYRDYSAQYHRTPTPERVLIFRENLKKIVEGNKLATTWTLGVNKFADMTREERQSYLGLNMTRRGSPSFAGTRLEEPVNMVGVPAEKDWRKEGVVTGVKDQSSCGSCYTFGAVGVLEINAIRTGKRKDFAEKEYLDCVYDRDGCDGGWSEHCWDYSAREGRLALTRDQQYSPFDGRCGNKYKRMHNGLIASKITGYTEIYGRGKESAFIKALSRGSVVVAFEVTDYFFNYQKGIVADKTCNDMGDSTANHAVTGVGYTRNSMIIKNSWGSVWGMSGYFETVRGTDDCEYFRWGSWPDWQDTGVVDNDPDYIPTEDDDCVDVNADGCPCGTVRCGDGNCRHVHMC